MIPDRQSNGVERSSNVSRMELVTAALGVLIRITRDGSDGDIILGEARMCSFVHAIHWQTNLRDLVTSSTLSMIMN